MVNTQKLPLVTYEQAKCLKEAGFQWECDHSYRTLKEKTVLNRYECPINWNRWQEKNTFVNAPTVALALKWYRDVKKIKNGINIYFDERSSDELYENYFITKSKIDGSAGYVTYEAAESA